MVVLNSVNLLTICMDMSLLGVRNSPSIVIILRFFVTVISDSSWHYQLHYYLDHDDGKN